MDKLDTIKKIVNTYSEISKNGIELLVKALCFEVVEEGTFVGEGKQSSQEYFILSGYGRMYVTSEDGVETTLTFLTPNTVAPPLKTRVSNGKSTVNIEALTELTIAHVDSRNFFQMCIENREIMMLGTKMMENNLLEKSEKEIALATLKGLGRLAFFRDKFPMLENFVSHQYIASYLGITNVSLSRLRSK